MRELFLTVLVLVIAGCGGVETVSPVPESVSHRELVDGIGRTVKLPERVDRVISLAPSVTEMIFAAGGGERLVGVTTYCNFPEQANTIEKVGDTQTPNIERIAALKPDVVFVSKASQLEAFMATLDRQRISVFVIDPVGIEGVKQDITTLAQVFGTEEAAGRTVSEIGRRAAEARRSVEGKARPRVFVQISDDPLFTIGEDSFLTTLISEAGGEAVTKDIPSAYPKLSKESASVFDPDVIILSDSEDNRQPNNVFKRSKAVTDGRIYRINADIIARPGPRLVDALEQIADFLHR